MVLGAKLNMANGIREFGHACPDRIAVVDGDRSFTFGALHERSSRLASALLDSGLRPGDAVAVLSGNRAEYFEIATALAKAGLPMVALNPKNQLKDNEFIVGHSDARALILDADLVANAESLIDSLDVVSSFDGRVGGDYESMLEGATARDPRVDVGDEDTFAISYTSGTTGLPKGVTLSHRGRVLTNYAAAIDFGLGPTRQTVAVAPLYHGAGFAFAFIGPQLGGTVWVQRSWDPEEFLRLLETSRANSVFLVPTHAHQVRRITEDPMSSYDLTALETIYFNAAALPVVLKEWVHEALPHVGLHEIYGSTECSVVTNLRPPDAMRKAGSVGHPWFMNEVRLLDDDGQEVPPGVPGELFARSPMLMTGYFRDEAATAKATNADGFVTVEDLAVRDDEGFISIVDRKKDMIISGGVNIYPREIEEVLARHADVDDVAVIGLPDDAYGERIAAFVVPRKGLEGIDFQSLESHARAGVATYKVPREWHVVDSLPRNPSGKILKRDIRANHESTSSER
jgi:long-chain acyl-CoA synthetase